MLPNDRTGRRLECTFDVRVLTSAFALILLLLTIVIPAPFRHGIASADTWISESKSSSSRKGEQQKKNTPKGVGFNEYREGLRNLCGYLGEDGRQELLYDILKLQDKKDTSCVACRPFFNLFAAVCKPAKKPIEKQKKIKKTKGQEEATAEESPIPSPSPKPFFPQREPNIRAIAAVSDVFSRLAGREEGEEETLKVMRKFLELIKNPEGRTESESYYLSLLATYIESPFRKALSEKESGAGGAERGEISAGGEGE